MDIRNVTIAKQADQVRRETQDRDRAMADALPVLVWQSGTDKLRTYFNKAWLEFTGRTVEQELGNGWQEGVHPQDLQHCLDVYFASFDRREPFELEYRLRHRSGEYRWIIDTGAPQFSFDETFGGYVGSGIDTHDRKRAEDALRQSEERFRLLAEGATDYASFILDPEGRVMSWNPGAEHVKGYGTEEILGQYFACFYPQEDVERGKPEQILRIAANEGRAEDEGWRIRNDGSRFWAHVVITALRDEDGRLRGFSKVTRNASDRRQADEAIQRSVGWLHSLIETTQDAVISIDRKGHVVLFNPAAERIFGYSKAEIQGQKVNVLMAEPYATEHDEYIARYERTGEARAIGRIRTVTARRKNGEPFPIELSVTEIAVDQDVHYAAFIRDISEKTRLQGQLLESERLAAIGTTAAKIGHELANPLNGMSLTVQLLEQRLNKLVDGMESQLTPTVKRLKDEISRLQKLVGQFATISRKEKYVFRPVNLKQLIDDIVALQAPHLART